MRQRLSVLSAALVFLLAATAAAHSPTFLPENPGNVVEHPLIRDPDHSRAVYGRLAPSNAVDLLPIEARAGDPLYIQVLTPVREGLRSFRPRAVLLGPGLRGRAPSDLPVQPTSGQGALPVPRTDIPVEIYEGFTQMPLWVWGGASSTFPADGRYTLAVYDPEEKGGPYTIAIGTKERFGPLDVLTFPLVWTRAKLWQWK